MNERKKRLLETMKSLNKTFKEETLFFGNEIENKEKISTGIKKIDKFLGGGIKRGTHTIFWGGIANGKTTLALQTIANAQKQGYICAYLNTEKPIDNERFDMLGVNRRELIRANCAKNAEQTLTIVKKLCDAKVVDLVVVDSVNALSPKAEQETKQGKERGLEEKNIAELARLLSEFCRKVNPSVYNASCAMIWIGQLRIGGIGTFYTRATLSCGEALKFYAYNIVYLRNGQSSDAPVKKFKEFFVDPDGKIRYVTKKEKIGFDSVFRMDRSNSGDSVREGEESHFAFIGEKGFVDKIEDVEDIPIKIDAENEEQKDKIMKYLVDKGIKKACKKLVNDDKALKKLAEDYLAEDEPKAIIHANPNAVAKFTRSEEPKKKKRGRPRKEKK